MNDFTKRLIPIAQAQIIDAVAQPSFGNLSNDSSQNRTLARIDLTPTSNISDLKVGDTFTIGINIKTFEEVTLNKIALKISFASIWIKFFFNFQRSLLTVCRVSYLTVFSIFYSFAITL